MQPTRVHRPHSAQGAYAARGRSRGGAEARCRAPPHAAMPCFRSGRAAPHGGGSRDPWDPWRIHGRVHHDPGSTPHGLLLRITGCISPYRGVRPSTHDGSSVRRDFVFERGGSNEIEKVEARAPARAHFSLGRPSCMSTQSDTSPSGPYSVDPTQAPVIPLSCVTRGLMSGRDHRRGGAHAISLNLSQSHTAKSIQYENVSFIQRFNLGSWTLGVAVLPPPGNCSECVLLSSSQRHLLCRQRRCPRLVPYPDCRTRDATPPLPQRTGAP